MSRAAFGGSAGEAGPLFAAAASVDGVHPHVGSLIRRLNQIAVALFLHETSGCQLTNVQYVALKTIARIPRLDQASLCGLIAIDKTTMVGVIDCLVRKGLVTRTRSLEDRRVNCLRATASGRALVDEVEPMVAHCEKRILAPLAAADQKTFLRLLTALVSANNAHSRAPVSTEFIDLLSRPPPRAGKRPATAKPR